MEGTPAYDHLLEVRALRTFFFTDRGVVKAVNDVSFDLDEGQILGLVGESGCGKTMTAMSLIRLVPPPGRLVGGTLRFRGRDLMGLPEKAFRKMRGGTLSLIFQEPGAALNPVLTVGFQIAETAMVHRGLSRREAMREAVRMLEEVRIPDAARRAREYPHQLSGGMKQRAMIAMALVCRPAILIADEPTTALDVTIQAQILRLLAELREKYGLSILLITHDLGVVAEIADRVAVMYAGKIVEEAGVRDLFREPRHPYTQGLLRSMRREGAGAGSRRLPAIEGTVPDLLDLPPGCFFSPRCPDRFDLCDSHQPPLLPSIGPAARGPAARRREEAGAAGGATEAASDRSFRKVACFEYLPPPEAPPPVSGAGWDPERGR
ncbi:MAG TPA: ABC transporter ATP-binding protein [Candidatus Saccharimonadales bacterium]|nr:ABC transporter ATP-binding protein [Candidatus Saccharimonadales bacterium]